MSNEEMDFPIDDELRGLAEDYLSEAQLPAEHVDQAFAQLSSKLGASASAGGLSTGAKVGVGLTLIAGAVVAALALRPTSTPPPTVMAQAPSEAPAPPVEPAPPLAPSVEMDPAPADTPAVDTPEQAPPAPQAKPSKASKTPKKTPRATQKTGETPAPVASSDAKAELLLLQRARKAMRSGQPSACLELLDQHEQSFPDSRFARERDATRVAALCKAGRETKAKQSAARFVKRYGRARASFSVDDPCKR